MVQLFLSILRLVALGFLFVVGLLLLFAAIKNWHNRNRKIIYSALTIVCVCILAYVWSTDLFSYESTNRDKCATAFEDNFGFEPPESIKEINLKNYRIYDSDAHWMKFTYDSAVFTKIIAHDQPLTTVNRFSVKFRNMAGNLNKGANTPDWWKQPVNQAPRIYYKMDFLDHIRSEYYIWADTVENMVYLHVSYSD